MAFLRNKIRVVLAQPAPFRLPVLSSALSQQTDFEVFDLKASVDDLWRQIINASPEVVLFYFPFYGEAEKRCLLRILGGTLARVIVGVNSPLKNGLGTANARLELMVLPWGGRAERVTDFARLISHIKSLGLAKRFPTQGGRMSVPAGNVSLSQDILTKNIIAIGASTGGTEALAKLFHHMPEALPGIVVVQHMPPVFTELYAQRLNAELSFTVTEAKDDTVILPRTIHIAPGGRQMYVEKRGSYFYTVLGGPEKHTGHCPSVNVLFESVAAAARRNAIGIILTGMGADGAEGLLKMRKSGAYTIGQDEASCVVYGMPQKAYEIGAVADQANLTEMPSLVVKNLAIRA